MSILTNSLTPAQIDANRVIQIVTQQYQSLQQSGIQGYNLIWNNRRATPQEMIAALGTNATVIFELAQINISTITQASDVAQTETPNLPSIPSNYELTFNEDGSATLTAVEPTQS